MVLIVRGGGTRRETLDPGMPAANPQLLQLGRNLRAIRQRAGLSQEALAEKSGVDRSYVGAVERGERNIAALNLIRLASALGVSVGEFFANDNGGGVLDG